MKRGWRIGFIVGGSVITVIGLLVVMLNMPRVQRALIGYATEMMEKQLHTRVGIEAVHYHFPLRCSVHGVYIEDEQGDTLLYAGKVYAHVSALGLMRREVIVRKVALDQVRLHAYGFGDGRYNYSFLLADTTAKDTAAMGVRRIEARKIELHDIELHYDTLRAQLAHARLAFEATHGAMEAKIIEGCGKCMIDGHREVLDWTTMEMEMLYTDTILSLPILRLGLTHSLLDASGIQIVYPRMATDQTVADYLSSEASKIAIRFYLNKFTLIPSDLTLFMPSLKLWNDVVEMRAHIDGSLDSLMATGVCLYFGADRFFTGNFSAVGLPDIHHTFLHLECQDLAVRVEQAERLIADLTRRPCVLPVEIHRLGRVHYRGVARGRLDHFHLDGAFSTQLGVITTHGSCVSDSAYQSCVIQGDLDVRRFQLGRMFANTDIGELSSEINTELHLSTTRAPYGSVRLKVSDFSYRDYVYEQLSLAGTFDNRSAQVTVMIDDPNVSFDLVADGDWNEDTMPHLDAELLLRHCYPGALHWIEGNGKHSGWHTKVALHQSYSSLGNLTGSLVIDSTYIENGEASVQLQELSVTMEDKVDYQLITIGGDVMNGTLSGQFDVRKFKDMILHEMVLYAPSLFTTEKRARLEAIETNMRFDYSLMAYRIRELQELLQLPVTISDNTALYGYYNDMERQWGVKTHIPRVAIGKAELHDLSVVADNRDEKLHIGLNMELDSALFGMKIDAMKDSVELRLLINSLPPYNNHGDLRVNTHFTHYARLPLIEAHILPGVIQLSDSVYEIDEGHVTYVMADSLMVFDHVCFHGNSQSIALDGVASSMADDSLQVVLSHINLGLMMPYLVPEQALKVDGYVSGWATIYSFLSAPIFEAKLRVDSTVFNGSPWGTVQAQVGLEHATKRIVIDGKVVNGAHQTAAVHGVAIPKDKCFELDVEADSIPISFIEHWTAAFLQDFEGTLSGKVKILGENKKTYVLARAKPNEASLMVPFTGCRYFVNDSIYMDSTSIRFPQLRMHDVEGNSLLFDGVLTHNPYFRDFNIDLHATCEHTLALDMPHSYGQMMEGKVYATGRVDIEGPDDDILLHANAMAVGKSHFQLSLGTSSSARDNSFVEFVQHQKPMHKDTMQHVIPHRKNPLFVKGASRFRLGLNVDIDPQTLFGLVLDERTGDMIEARGDGSIKFTMDDATDEIQLVGTYTIASGKMGFTIGNLIRRDFTIESGSQIIWNGKAEQPLLDVTAKYQVTASLKDLFGSETEQLVSGRTTVPVATRIHLSGALDDPIIRFGIELPKSEENIENQVKAIINTDEMMMREVVYLLVFGKFFTPEYVKTSGTTTTLNNTYALLSSTITGQINNWLGKLTNVFTLGFNIRSEGTDQKSAQEYEAVFQLQPVDRLIINGNFGYRYNDISNRPFFGDLDIECLLTPNGKYRLKGYTHTVDKYSLKQASTTQGIGFLFRHDFNWRRTEEEKRLREAQRAAQKAAKTAEKSRKKSVKE